MHDSRDAALREAVRRFFATAWERTPPPDEAEAAIDALASALLRYAEMDIEAARSPH